MKNAKFTEFVERGLALGRQGGWEKEIKAREELAWVLQGEFPPTGSLVLGQLLLEQKASYLKQDVKAREFANALLAEAVPAVQAIEDKDGWDYYHLGLCFAYGRGVPRDWLKAAGAFDAAHRQGNPYAEFEAIWARYLAGGSRLEAMLGLLELKGALADFAALSARALGLLETGPVREVASGGHIARILLLRSALHDFIYHHHGAKRINIAIEKELRAGVDELRQINTPRAYLALYLTACVSRANPTGKAPIDWFRDAVDPSLEELEVLCRRHELGTEELRIILQRAERDGWRDSKLASVVAQELELLEE